MEKDEKNIKDLTFRQAMEQLIKTIELLEGNTLELEDSLEKYKYGVELLAHLKRQLSNAQIQVEQLMGQIESEDITDQQRDTTLS